MPVSSVHKHDITRDKDLRQNGEGNDKFDQDCHILDSGLGLARTHY